MAKKKEQTNIEKKIKFRIKDEEGNYEDYASLESMAVDMGINLGVCYKFCDSGRLFMGLKIYTVKE